MIVSSGTGITNTPPHVRMTLICAITSSLTFHAGNVAAGITVGLHERASESQPFKANSNPIRRHYAGAIIRMQYATELPYSFAE